MSDQDRSPLEAAQKLTPWWMMRIREFDRLDIKPCAIIGHTLQGKEIVEPCEPEQASFWTVYGHYRPREVWNGVEAFEDFNTEAAAQKFYNQLLKTYPHLNADLPRAQYNLIPNKLTL